MKTGHFYFGKNRTFLFWFDSLSRRLLPARAVPPTASLRPNGIPPAGQRDAFGRRSQASRCRGAAKSGDESRLITPSCHGVAAGEAGRSLPTLVSKTTIESSLPPPRSSPWTASKNRDSPPSPYPTNVLTEDSPGAQGTRIPKARPGR